MATVVEGTTYIPVFGNDVVITGVTCLVTSVNYVDSPPLTEVKNGAGDTTMRVWSDNAKSKRLSLEVVPYGGTNEAGAITQTTNIGDAGGTVTLTSTKDGEIGTSSSWKVLSKTIKGTNSDVQTVSLELAPAL